MSDKLFDTQELSEIRKLIGDEEPKQPSRPSAAIPPQSSSDYDLNQIIAEVSGTVDKTAKTPRPQPRVSQRTGAVPRVNSQRVSQRTGTIPRVSQGTGRIPPQTGRIPLQGTGRIPRVPQGSGRVPQGSGRVPQGSGRVSQASGRIPQINGHVSQVSGRIPRIPGADPWEVDQALRANAEQQARQLAAMTEEAEKEDKLSRKERKRLERQRREEEERARDKEDEIEFRDPKQAQRYCKKRARNLAQRSIIVLIFGLLATYITVASGMGLPLPSVFQYTEHAYLTIMTLMILQFIAMFIGLDVVSNGFYNLFTFKADRASLVVCSLLASLFHGTTIITLQWTGWIPYCAVSIILLFAQMQEEKARMAGRYRAYKAATLGDHPTGVYAHQDGRDHIVRTVKYRMPDLNGFLREMERNDQVEMFERIYVPLAIIASFAFAAVSSFGTGNGTSFFWALSAILSISAPLGILCGFGAAYRNVSRKLLAEGAALPSARQASQMRHVQESILGDGDVFPAGSITMEGIQNYGAYSEDKLLAYASAVTAGKGLEIGRVLSESLRERYARPVRASNITHYESGGMSADIGADSVLVGTASFLGKLGIRQPTTQNADNPIYVVINSQIAGEISLKYHPTAQTYGALHALERIKIRPVLSAQDFNISPAMVESMFEVRHGTMDAVDPSRIPEISNPRYVGKDRVCALLSKDGAMPYVMVQQAAGKLVGAMRSNLLIGTIAGVCGILLMFYLTFKGAAEAVEPKNVLLYLLLWYIPVFFISLTTRRNY
jgi:hypothetical protein